MRRPLIHTSFVRRAAFAGCLALVGCTSSDGPVDPADIDFPAPTTSSTTAASQLDPPVASTAVPDTLPVGGSVSVGLWSEPDPAAETLVGAMVRGLVYPQLFEPSPSGGWTPGLVEPDSDVDGPEVRSANFRLRDGAVWSDGTPITMADLGRTADTRFVTDLIAEDDGSITVTFNQPLPNWRRLWSGDAVVLPADDGVHGGPFRVASMVDGLETVLVRNERWWGTPAALDELRLVVVPDQRIQFELFERGELDVLAPLPTSGRSAVVADLTGASVVSAPGEGWWFGLTIDPSEVNRNDRLALQNAADAEAWVGALLKDEAVHVTSLGGTPVDLPFRGPDEVSNPISLVAPTDLPLIGLAQRAVLLPVRDDGGLVPELREGISLDAEPWGRESDAYLGLHWDGPGGPCWTCRFESTDGVAMRLADAGGAPPDQLLADQGTVQPWYRPIVMTVFRSEVGGVEANGWALGPVWNAERWFRTD